VVTSQILGGAKCSGQLVTMKGAFDALDKYVQITCKTKTVGEAMNDLLNPALLNTSTWMG
jgi:hypothetical protein